MLKNTLILPETDARFSAKLLQDAIDTLDVILMFVFGKSPEAKQTVEWADQLSNKTIVSETFNLRKVVWIRNPTPVSLRTILSPILGDGPLPHVAVLNFRDELKGTISEGEEIRPIKLERLFLKGHRL